MCMEYVNATVEACKVIRTSLSDGNETDCEDNRPLKSKMDGVYLVPFQLMEAEVNENRRRVLPEFRAVVRVNVMGSANGKSSSPVDTGEILMFRLNLTHFTEDPKERKTEIVGMFEVDPKKISLCEACVPFVNSIYYTDVPRRILPEGNGEYVLKLLVRKKKDGEELVDFKTRNDGFVIKSMAKLHFWTKDEIEDKCRKPDCPNNEEEVVALVPETDETDSV